MTDPAGDLRATFDAVSRSLVAEIPAEQAENAGWERAAMPPMLRELELSEAPAVTWFVPATNPLYDATPADGWRYCHTPENGPDLLGIAFSGPPPRVYLRADMSLPRTIRTLGHELYHVREFLRGDPTDEAAADDFGRAAAARFLAAGYR